MCRVPIIFQTLLEWDVSLKLRVISHNFINKEIVSEPVLAFKKTERKQLKRIETKKQPSIKLDCQFLQYPI